MLLILFGGPFLLWWFKGENYFSLTDRQPATVLIVEGWIGVEGVQVSRQEFARGGYDLIVTVGGLSTKDWGPQRWSFAIEARKILLQAGVPPDQVIAAPSEETKGQRTFAAMAAAWRTLQAQGIRPKAINVFTRGAHARRSRLIAAKIFGPERSVGVVAWIPTDYDEESWWDSSERADDLLKETVAYPFELLLNSGRLSNSAEAGRK